MKTKVKSTKGGFGHKGGSTKMAGKSGAAPAEAGKVSVGGRAGNNTFKASGGGKKMAGFTPAPVARAK